MNKYLGLVAVSLLCLFFQAGVSPARAQTTDGYHTIQVFPVVVDTASFSQRLTFRNPNTSSRTLQATYYPAEGTAQAAALPAALTCPAFAVPGERESTFTSLRQLCPDLVPGTAFGTLVVRHTAGGFSLNAVFAAFSRVSNPAGNGFSVEAFPAHTFSSAVTVVTGLRRRAATTQSPAFQTNCFVGNLAETTADPNPVTSTVVVSLRSAAGNQIGQTQVQVAPGKLVRLLDVFAAVGDTTNDYDDAVATFDILGDENPGLLTFCTVQDNTSFGADFRIGKQELGLGFLVGWQDNSIGRNFAVSGDFRFSGEALPRKFGIPAGASGNVHVLYFRHPDVVGCSILKASDNSVALASYGLEMRLLANVNGTADYMVLAGGNDVTSFASLYLGDKADRGNGSSTRYMLEVESNGQNEGVERLYKLHCRSGSGHNLGEMVKTGAAVSF